MFWVRLILLTRGPEEPLPSRGRNPNTYYVKRQQISKIIFEKFAFYGLDMEPEPEPKPEPEQEP